MVVRAIKRDLVGCIGMVQMVPVAEEKTTRKIDYDIVDESQM